MFVPTIKIRFANNSDIPEATEFIKFAIQDPQLNPDCSEYIGTTFLTNLETEPQNFLLAIDEINDGFIMGFLEIGPQQSEINKNFFISRLYVLPQYDKQEIAGELVQKMFEEKCLNGEELIVEVCHECEKKFYENIHFLRKSSILSMKL